MILSTDCFDFLITHIFASTVNTIILTTIGKEMYLCLSSDHRKTFFKAGMLFFSKRLASGVSKKCIGVTSTIKDCFVNKISIPFSHGYIVSITGKFSEILCIFIHKRIILQRTLNVIEIRQRNLSHLIDC